jgi:lipopolysaccharide/colanic/teichoic acid biosynthesis glycosyltransferase
MYVATDTSAGDLAVLVIGGLVAAAVLFAVAEQFIRRVAGRSRRGKVTDSPPGISTLRAQRIYEHVLYGLSPALVGALLIAIHDAEVSHGLAVAVALLISGFVFWPERSPLHLMPVARNAVRLLAPVAGFAIALAPGLVSSWDIDPGNVVGPLLGTELVVLMAMVLEAHFDTQRPVRLAIYGQRELADKLAAEMRISSIRTYRVLGYIAEEPEPGVAGDPDIHWLGSPDDVRAVVVEHGLDLLAVGPDTPRLQAFEQTAKACLDLPVRMIEASALYEDVLGHVPIGTINSAWFQCIMHPRYSPSSSISKRALDLLVTAPAALLVALPLSPLFAIAIKLTDGGPVFYRQRRVGEGGREFDILKFRTMRVGSLALADKVPKADLITPVGKLLRRSHLDELPQLFNVIKGDMTVVGPRPEQPHLVEALAQLVPYYERRALVKPGLTGWAQVRCGYAGTHMGTAWKMCHDLFYVKRRSIVFDVLIMLQTLRVLTQASEDELPAPNEDFILGDTVTASESKQLHRV